MAQKSKFFRVATEGATTDGRQIERAWIQQMAKNFDPKKYGARIWLEHYRGIYPDSSFRAYGDVVAVEAREVEDKKVALFAMIEPLPELVAMTKSRQKIYTSIEVTPKFADTGEAYLTGLAVTDSPASLGTEVLSFAQQKPEANPLAGRKSNKDALFSEAIEASLEFEEAAADDALARKFSDRIKGIVASFTGKAKSDDERFAAIAEGLESIGTAVTEQVQKHSTALATAEKALAELSAKHGELNKQFTALHVQLDITPAHHSQRPPATGSSAAVQTDC